jgi:hypothetical protein
MTMPNAIYPPHWHKVPPPVHPVDRWVVVLLLVVLLLAVLMVVGGG